MVITVTDQIETEHESDFEDVVEELKMNKMSNVDENEGDEGTIHKDTDVNLDAPSLFRLGSFKIAPPKRVQRETGTSSYAKNYKIRKIQGLVSAKCSKYFTHKY